MAWRFAISTRTRALALAGILMHAGTQDRRRHTTAARGKGEKRGRDNQRARARSKEGRS